MFRSSYVGSVCFFQKIHQNIDPDQPGYAPGHHAGHRSDADLAAKEIEIAVDGVLDMLHDFRREAGPRHLRIHPAQRVVAEQRRPICAGEEG